MEEVEEANDKIAIVGIGCNFPGGEGIENFWKVIVEGRNCTVDIPSERFDTKFWCNQDLKKPGKISTSRAAVIDGFNEFDNILFGIHNSEVATMDPQQKLLLECTYRALEDAGIPAEHISGSKTGVFVGLMNHDFESICNNSADGINHFNATGTSTSIAANRISYCFNLTGPSLAIDTACSSSLVALHYACQAIKQGDCDMAICGGVSCIIEPRVYVALSKANMISPDGISKPFSQRADGYGRGEGCGVVLLKTLKRAKDDFSKVWGVLLASAVNQDGKSITPISKPSQKQQEDLLQRIYATINPSLVHYVEAHGTGTPIGDPIEAASIGNIMGKKRHRESPPLKIGSVKGNIGHTESAAGMAGLIKVLLMMHNEVIPPSLHYSEELSIRNTKELNLMIPTSPEKWEDPGKYSRIAGVNSFGFGGTNAHVVIKQHRLNYTQCFSKRPVEIFILSAVSSKSLEQTIKHTEQELKRTISTSLQNLVYTAACRRSHIHYKYRRAFLTSSLTDLQQQLASAYTETSPVKGSPRVVFVFCGNGVNHKGMCKMLLRSEPVFRNKCIEIDEVLQVYTPISMVDLLDNEFDDFSRPEIAQPLLFTIQVSLVALLRFWGIKPDSIVGHSVGEVAAAHCSGLLSLQDAVQVIYHRSTLQAKATGGKMLVVSNIPVTDISKLIEPYSGQISIAAYNSPTSCTLSGDSNLVEHIHSKLKQNNNKGTVFLHLLDVPAAYHSHMMDSILDELKANLQNLKTEKLETEIISTVTGQVASQGDFTTGEYWARNIREPVAFEQALKSLTTSKQDSVFIEIGPRRALQRYIVEVLGKNSVILPTGSDKEYNTLFAILGKLFTYNINPNWCNIYEAYKSAPAAIPKYQFDHIKQEIKYEKIRQGKQNVSTVIHPLLQCANEDMTEFISTISEATTPYIYEHRNNGSVLVPGTFYVELGLAATMTSIKPKVPLSSLEISVAFSSPCVINQQSIDLKIKLKQRNNTTNFEIQTSYIYATGQVQTKPETFEEDKKISFPHIFKRCTSYYTKDQIYDKLSKIGFQYGNVYKQLSDVHYGGDLKEAIAVINISETIKDEMYEYYIHPVILDSFLQMFACLATEYQESATFFPSSIGSLTILRPLQKKMFIYIKEVTTNENYFDICGYFVDLKGFILAEVKHAKLTSIKERTHKTDSFFFQSTWKEVSRLQYTNKSEQEPKILILTDIYGIGQQLTKYIPRGLTFIMHNNWDSTDTKIQLTKVFSNEYNDVLFMWGVHPVHEEFTSNLTQLLAKYCEVYQQVILAVRQQTSRVSIRIVTYRTTDNTVDHINPGSALIGMTRACILEMPDLKFQLIDINSSNPSTMEALAKVVLFNKPEEYPEVWIKDGNIYMNEITLSDVHVEKEKQNLVALKHSDNFTLCSVDPFKVTELSAEPIGSINNELIRKHVEVEIDKIAIHTEDYFPVTFSSYHHGSALYWHTLTKDKHKIMALDFTGTVTAVGKGVNKLKVGEYIVSCYPVVASSRVILPEMVCYSVKSVPTLRNPLCISKFILAWEILHQLPQAKNKSKLAIRTTEANSVLCKILTRIAKRSGWEPTTYSDSIKYTKECNAMIILPPLVTNLVEDFCHLSLLKDLVIICDRKNPESFHNLSESCKENVHVHFLNLDTIFQKAYIKKIAKRIYKWIKLIDVGMIPSAPHLISLFADSTNCENCTRKCYFTDTFIPLIELEKSKLSSIPLSLSRQKLFQHNSIYIVTGGLSGLGFETVKFIVQHGGGYIVIMSRRKPTPVMQQQIQMVQDEKKNTVIMSLQCNAANYSEVMKSMELILKVYPNIPIKGIFHSAVVLHDGLLQHLNVSHFEKVLSPKVEGAINLHRATINQDLDYFVCYSSIASFVGNPGQANYAAANSFLDMFCQYRRNIGLSGQSISWGALNLGLLLNQENIHSLLQARGILLLDKLEIHEHLRKALTLNNPNQAIVKFDFKTLHDNLISHIPSLKQRFFNVVLENLNNLSNTRTFNLPRDISINPENYVKSLISEITSVDVRDITGSTPLNTLGIDSMLGMTLQNQIFKETEINIPLVKLLDPNITVSMLVSMVRENIANTEEIVEDTRL